MPLAPQQLDNVAARINYSFDEVSATYNFTLYPAEDYEGFKNQFHSLSATDQQIQDALRWKWGKWNHSNFPATHKKLIQLVQKQWPAFLNSGKCSSPESTFQWWKSTLMPCREPRFVTVAYLTHLIHHLDPVPIIDQHNFRAMNHFLRSENPFHSGNSKPSQWSHIIELRDFMKEIQTRLPSRSFGDIDRFLMMFGSGVVRRNVKRTVCMGSRGSQPRAEELSQNQFPI